MEINVGRTNDFKDNMPLTPKEVEDTACAEIAECLEFFETNTVRAGPEGVYLKVGNNIHVLSVEIKYLRVLKPNEEVPVDFCRKE